VLRIKNTAKLLLRYSRINAEITIPDAAKLRFSEAGAGCVYHIYCTTKYAENPVAGKSFVEIHPL